MTKMLRRSSSILRKTAKTCREQDLNLRLILGILKTSSKSRVRRLSKTVFSSRKTRQVRLRKRDDMIRSKILPTHLLRKRQLTRSSYKMTLMRLTSSTCRWMSYKNQSKKRKDWESASSIWKSKFKWVISRSKFLQRATNYFQIGKRNCKMKKLKLIRRMKSLELKSKPRRKLLTNASKASSSVIKHKKQKNC